MKKVLVISNDSYGMNNVKVALKHADIEWADSHNLMEMLISVYPKIIKPKIDFLGNDILKAEKLYAEEYTEDYILIYFNGGEEMYACKLSIDAVKECEVDLTIE